MSTIKNSQISLYFHFKKIMKGPRTSFQSPALNQKMYQFDSTCFKRNKHNCNFHYVTRSMMASHILKSMDFTKKEKSRYLENET